MRAAASFLDLAPNAPGDVVSGEQLGWPPSVLVSGDVAPALLDVGRRLWPVVFGDVLEHEALPRTVAEDPALTPHTLGDEDAAHARGPHHPGGMELNELHVHQLGTRVVRQRLAVPCVFPAVARDLVRPPDTAGGQ